MKLRNKILTGVAAFLGVAIVALAITMSYESPCPRAPATAASGETMRAVMQRCYGSPAQVLTVENIAKPVPKQGQVLIKVRATGLNPFEWHMTTGKPYLIHLFRGLGAPDHMRLGNDAAGVVEAVGPGVTRFKPGDEVFGDVGGALAEYAIAGQDGDIVLKPAELSFEEAAGIPIAAVTALQGLRDHGHLTAGQKVLINGASGGVGTYAIQIAKSLGAEVTAVCSTRNVAMVRSLGADHVIDYTKQDFSKGAERFDVILDSIGNHGVLALRGVLESGGTLVGIGGSKKEPWIGPILGMLKRKIIDAFVDEHLVGFIASMNTADLEYLAHLAHEGKMRTVIDRRYPLEGAGAALEYIGSQRARGKVIVTFD